MKQQMRIRIRWIDLLLFRLPRYVLNGKPLHANASRRIRHMVNDECWQMIRGRRPGHWRMMQLMLIAGAIGCTVPLVSIGFFSSPVFAPVNDFLNPLPEWLDLILTIPFGVIAAIPFMYLLGHIATWWLQPEFARAINFFGSHRCLYCDYDLRGTDPSHRCPECGEKRELLQ